MEIPSRPAVSVFAAAVALLLPLSGCRADTPEETTSDAQAAEDTDNATSADEVTPARDFEVRTVDDEEFAGASLEGKAAVLWFWAPWCTVCQSEAEGVVEAGERYADEVEFLGVAGLGQVGPMQEFVADHELEEMTHLVDNDGTVWSGFGVTRQPSFSFLRPDGTHHTVQGVLTDEELDGYIEEELLDTDQNTS